MSTLVGHFVSSPNERKKRDSRRDEKEGQGRERNRNESEETEEMKKVNKHCLLHTPRKVTVDINSSSVQNIKKVP